MLGVNAIHLNVDPWLNLPHVRFAEHNRAEHFYKNAIRFEDMFASLILPLKRNREVSVVVDYAEETATSYRHHRFEFDDIDVIILEGIYLFQKALRHHFDLTIWIDCSFETALKRAIKRGQEGLSVNDTIRAYETIYFPAQRLHFAIDNPRESANLILSNDIGEI
jgi:uridine kinase